MTTFQEQQSKKILSCYQVNDLEKGRKSVPIGTKSKDGKFVKTESGWEFIKKEKEEKIETKNTVSDSIKKYLGLSYKTNVNVYDQILNAAKPYLDNIVKKYEEYHKEHNIPFTERDKEYVELQHVSDVVNAVSKYLKEGDDISNIDIHVSKNAIQINSNVIRDGKKYFFNTEMIYAGGWNVQKLHYRYLISTDLPKQENKSVLNKIAEKIKSMKAVDRVKDDIRRTEQTISRLNDELKQLTSLTPDEIIKERFKFYYERYGTGPKYEYLNESAKEEIYPTPESYNEHIRKEKEGAIKDNENKINATKSRIKSLEKDLLKYKNKFDALNQQQ